MTYSAVVGKKEYHWSSENLAQKLQAISGLKNKKTAWIKSDLSISHSSWLTRLIWTIFAKSCNCIRKYFGVDLEQTQKILTSLQPQVTTPEMKELFTKAVTKFNEIAPKHQVILQNEMPSTSVDSNKPVTSDVTSTTEPMVVNAPQQAIVTATGNDPQQATVTPVEPTVGNVGQAIVTATENAPQQVTSAAEPTAGNASQQAPVKSPAEPMIGNAPQVPVTSTAEPVNIQEINIPSTKQLIARFTKCWDDNGKCYKDITFNRDEFLTQLKECNSQFSLPYDLDKDFGYIAKRDLEPGTKIYVRADLHGDLKSLLENLLALQNQGLLDSNFKCNPKVQLVFLGDYADRGTNSTQILQVLAALKLENPEQVNLIRGNHEYICINQMYGGNDPNFRTFLKSDTETDAEPDVKTAQNREALLQFYRMMPLTMYMSEITNGERQYLQFTHGVFELYVDPAQILDQPEKYAQIAVPRTGDLCDRIKAIKFDANTNYVQLLKDAPKSDRKELKLKKAAQTISELYNKTHHEIRDSTNYNWANIDNERPSLTNGFYLGGRGANEFVITGEDVKDCIRLASSNHKVKMVMRGHQHKMEHYTYKGIDKLGGEIDKVVVTTLPVGMDSIYGDPFKSPFSNQPDRAYILSTKAKVRNWTKQAFTRERGVTGNKVSHEMLIRTNEIAFAGA